MVKNISKNLFWKIIIIFIAIRILLVVLQMLGIPSAEFINYFPSGTRGDEAGYFEVAKSFSDFKAVDSPGFGTIGAALVYVPYIWMVSAENLEDIWKISFIFQAFLLYPISIILVALIGKMVFKNKLLGVITAFLYLIYPFVLYFLNIGPYEHNYGNFMHSMWYRPVMSDAPSALFVYLGVFLFLYSLEKNNKRNVVFSAAASGFAALVRITNILVCTAMGLVYLFQKRYKDFLIFFLVSLAIFSLQLFFNNHNYGGFLRFGQFSGGLYQEAISKQIINAQHGHINIPTYYHPTNYLYFLTVLDEYIPYLEKLLVGLIVFTVLSLICLFKLSKGGMLIVLFWITIYMLYYGGYSSSARSIRYWLPIIPAILIIMISYYLFIVKIIKLFILLFKNKLNNNILK